MKLSTINWTALHFQIGKQFEQKDLFVCYRVRLFSLWKWWWSDSWLHNYHDRAHPNCQSARDKRELWNINIHMIASKGIFGCLFGQENLVQFSAIISFILLPPSSSCFFFLEKMGKIFGLQRLREEPQNVNDTNKNLSLNKYWKL